MVKRTHLVWSAEANASALKAEADASALHAGNGQNLTFEFSGGRSPLGVGAFESILISGQPPREGGPSPRFAGWGQHRIPHFERLCPLKIQKIIKRTHLGASPLSILIGAGVGRRSEIR